MNKVWNHQLFWPSVLVVVGVFFLLHNIGWLDWVRADIFWPIVLIAVGAWLIFRRVRP